MSKTFLSITAATLLLTGALVAQVASSTPAGTAAWPTGQDRPLFLWKNGDKVRSPSVAFDKAGAPINAYGPVVRGNAILGRHHEMVLRGGSYHAAGLGEHLSAMVTKGKALAFEAYLTPPRTAPAGTGRIVSYTIGDETAFALAQRGDELLVSLRGAAGWQKLATLPAAKPVHLAVSCEPAQVVAWLDGKEAARLKAGADVSDWKPGELVFGDALAGGENWPGRLEGVLLRARALPAAEAQQDAAAYAALAAARPGVAQARFRGTLLRRSEAKTEIAPYFRALGLFEYKVDQVLSGKLEGDKVLVFGWTVMHRKLLPDAERPLGKSYEVAVEPFDAHPQLECELQFDTFERDFSAPVFYDTGE